MIDTLIAATGRLVSGATVRWVDSAPHVRQRVYFANHTSHLDFVTIWSALPPATRRLTRPVAGRDYWDQGPLRRYLAGDVFRAVLVDRRGTNGTSGALGASRRALDDLLLAIGDRYSLILFPEGTRGRGPDVGAFKGGLYHLCLRKPTLELVPVHIENLNRILPKGEILPVPMLSRVTFGSPMWLAEGEPKSVFLERARRAVVRLGQL
jgi:1-acyl-sn-glycerol-3-phosphate acyltransferase